MDDVKAAVTIAGDTNSLVNSGARQFSLGMDHGLSKSTSFYALYSKINNGAKGAYQLGNADANSNTASLNGENTFCSFRYFDGLEALVLIVRARKGVKQLETETDTCGCPFFYLFLSQIIH